jgi:hypothetical protein
LRWWATPTDGSPTSTAFRIVPRRSYSQWEYFFAQGERLTGVRLSPIDTYVYFANPTYLASKSVVEAPHAAMRQQTFVAELRRSGKDWNEFGSIDQLRALVLRDGFRLQPSDRATRVQQLGAAFATTYSTVPSD